MDVDDLIAQLELHGTALASAAVSAGPQAPVPTCPGWSVRDLLAHVGMVHRWAAGIVRDEPDATKRSDFPAPPDGIVEWFSEGHSALVAALRAARDDLDVWAFLPAASPLAFWARRQAHETAIHRADADRAAGRSTEYDETFALDGIAELLEGFFARPRGKLVADPPFTLLVAPSTATGSWTIEVGPETRCVTRHDRSLAQVDADAGLRGTASELYLELWNRAHTAQVSGDPRVMQLWRERATVSWS